ncbi:VOC family protein [Oceanirhabdus sp. W0125-5]|uniref:VOC family protein n=1 Tax=Oceanirhabdus sp. W0125-5 TaxID=2999116 RepID=UPI0022F2B7D9|nr:VOC family protein [Oceanirhabdus sp. W0125-5]WBW99310.1 VOC family protein [Oceanirhabdus sp. W0125-5]
MVISKQSIFKNIDCVQFYIPNLQDGLEYYCKNLGLRIIWRTDSAIGLGMSEGITEVVIQNERKTQEIDIKVESVIDTIAEIKKAGGEIICGPFDIKIGKCAVVKDPWGNQYVILDATKGTFITDHEGNIIGQSNTAI